MDTFGSDVGVSQEGLPKLDLSDFHALGNNDTMPRRIPWVADSLEATNQDEHPVEQDTEAPQASPEPTRHASADVDLVAELRAHRYLLGTTLGCGAFGTVYAATALNRPGDFAIKVVKPRNARVRKRLMREMQGLTRVRSPFVVHAEEMFFIENGQLCIVMQRIRGESLQDVLDRKEEIDPVVALSISIQLARGLSAIHLAGMVHCDIKPANILLEPDRNGEPHAHIIDFGLAHFLQDESSGKFFGTPTYTSPEHSCGRVL